MIINKLVFPVKLDGSFVEGSIPSAHLTANSINRDMFYVISPKPQDTIVCANFQNSLQSGEPDTVVMLPSEIEVNELVSKDASYYELIKDWNVWQGFLPSLALEKVAFDRASPLGISFSFKQLIKPKLPNLIGYEHQGIIDSENFIPSLNGYYYIGLPYYEVAGISFTKNDLLIKTSSEIIRKQAIPQKSNTGTLTYSVDPSVMDGVFEEVETSLTESIVSSISEIKQDLKVIKLTFRNYYTRDETYNRLEIDSSLSLLELKDQEQDQRLDNIETDIGNITESIKIDNDTLVREKEVIKVSDKLTNQINVNKSDILNIKNTTYTKLETDNKLSNKENKISQFVKDVKYDIANNRLTFEFKVGSNLVVNMTGGGVGGIDLEDVYLEENELVFIFTNEKEVRVPLGSLLVGMASEEWVEYRLNLYAEKVDLELLEGTVSTLETTLVDTQTTANNNKTEINTLKTTTQTHTIELEELENKTTTLENDLNEIMTGKQDKLIAGENITIENNVISASGGGGEFDLNSMAYFNYAGSIYGAKYNLLASAWEHSLTVDPLEISENSPFSNPKGIAQYPNGENEGVIIPQGVTSIGNNVFRGWTSNNQPLVIPNSVTSIGNYAFDGWTSNNHSLVIPDSVASINYRAFYNWTSNNKPLVIPDSVLSIGTEAFYNWTSNNKPLVIPDSALSIGTRAFMGWTSNNQPLVIPNRVTSIGVEAFKFWVLVPYIEMKGTTPPTLVDKSAFDNQKDAPIYVPDSAVDTYKNATNWSALASRIFPISEK